MIHAPILKVTHWYFGRCEGVDRYFILNGELYCARYADTGKVQEITVHY